MVRRDGAYRPSGLHHDSRGGAADSALFGEAHAAHIRDSGDHAAHVVCEDLHVHHRPSVDEPAQHTTLDLSPSWVLLHGLPDGHVLAPGLL